MVNPILGCTALRFVKHEPLIKVFTGNIFLNWQEEACIILNTDKNASYLKYTYIALVLLV